ncbi:hypothetical protein KY289_007230 [Solanum tuberosum]|nr:hypothetical protein KY289_007230 [Solanum tuberosum]
MQKEKLVLQESSIDEMGAFLIFAPIELPTITSIVNGHDATKVPILPSGIIISPDGRLVSDRGNTANAQNEIAQRLAKLLSLGLNHAEAQ